MNKLFIEVINRKYPNLFVSGIDKYGSYIKCQPECPEFGEVSIYENDIGTYILNVGRFTHCHFDCYEGTDEEVTKEAAKDMIDFLEDLFSDNVLCFSWNGGGGCERVDYGEAIDINEYKTDIWVWSGIYKKYTVV